MTRSRAIVIAAAILSTAGCNAVQPEQQCTLIGCSSGVTVQLSGNPGESYRVEIYEGGSNIATKVQNCSLGAECQSRIHFADYQPQGAVRIRVVTSRGAITSQPQNLTYVASTPNGPNCAPTCLVALVNMPLPA